MKTCETSRNWMMEQLTGPSPIFDDRNPGFRLRFFTWTNPMIQYFWSFHVFPQKNWFYTWSKKMEIPYFQTLNTSIYKWENHIKILQIHMYSQEKQLEIHGFSLNFHGWNPQDARPSPPRRQCRRRHGAAARRQRGGLAWRPGRRSVKHKIFWKIIGRSEIKGVFQG